MNELFSIWLGKLLPPRESAYERGYNWAKSEIATGTSEDEIASYLNESDEFDLGARDYLIGIKMSEDELLRSTIKFSGTAEQWWDLAPWNYDMNSAPKDGTLIMIKDVDESIEIAWYGFRGFGNDGGFVSGVAWLPLPENK